MYTTIRKNLKDIKKKSDNMAKKIWTGKEPFLRHEYEERRQKWLKHAFILLVVLLAVLLVTTRITNDVVEEDSKEEFIEDLSEYEGMDNKELIKKLYDEKGWNYEESAPLSAHRLLVKKYKFEPYEIVVDQDDEVEITVRSLDDYHKVRIQGYFQLVEVNAGEEKIMKFKANRPGTYVIDSPIYEQIQGRLIVKEKEE